jgi:osomolarity two-component system sensor histidine kinase CHK1
LVFIGASLAATSTTEESLRRSFAYGRLAIRIIEKLSAPGAVACYVYKYFASHVFIWHRPLLEARRYSRAAITKGQETYDLAPTCVACVDLAFFGLFSGESLDRAQARLDEARPFIRKNGRSTIIMVWLAMPMQMVHNLQGIEPTEYNMVDPSYNEAQALAHARKHQSHTHLFIYHFYLLVESVIMGRTDIALKAARSCEMHKDSVVGSYTSAMYTFYSAVLYIDAANEVVETDLMLIRKHMERIRLWAKTSPSTFEHKYLLLKAMMLKNGVNDLAKLDAFDEAISLAFEQGFIHDAALYAERCARWLSASSPSRSVHYLAFAKRQYEAWGAHPKAAALSASLPITASVQKFCICICLSC